MTRRLSIAALTLLLAWLCLPVAQADDKPVVGILRFGDFPTAYWMEGAILDMLRLYGWISADERDMLRAGEDLENARISLFWGDAGLDFNQAAFLIDEALDREPDALVTLSTPMTQAALNATLPMQDPPTLIFADVYNPVEAGILQASCLKPAHVTGVEAVINYEDILPLLLLQHPELETLGSLYNPSAATGSHGARRIRAVAESLGMTVKAAPALSLADAKIAAESLLGKGVDAILIPYDLSMSSVITFIAEIAMEYETPVYQASLVSVYGGAAMSAGNFAYYEQGALAGSMLIAQLNGELDIASAGVHRHGTLAVALNFDVAQLLGMQFTDALIDVADVTIENNITEMDPAWGLMTQQRAQLLPLEEQRAKDRAFLDSLHCSAERIAQQRARLAEK